MWPLLLALAGTGFQIAGAKKSQKAADSAYSAEMQRQKVLRDQSQAVLGTSQGQMTPESVMSKTKAGAERHKAGYDAAEGVPLAASAATAPLQRSATTVNTNREQARQESSDTRRAGLMGYSEWELQRAIENLLNNQQLGLTQNFAQGSNSVLPLELQAAQRAGEGLTGFGSLLSTAGMMTGLAGATAPKVGNVVERAATMQANPALQSALVNPSLLANATNPNWAFGANVKPFSLFGGY